MHRPSSHAMILWVRSVEAPGDVTPEIVSANRGVATTRSPSPGDDYHAASLRGLRPALRHPGDPERPDRSARTDRRVPGVDARQDSPLAFRARRPRRPLRGRSGDAGTADVPAPPEARRGCRAESGRRRPPRDDRQCLACGHWAGPEHPARAILIGDRRPDGRRGRPTASYLGGAGPPRRSGPPATAPRGSGSCGRTPGAASAWSTWPSTPS